MHAYLKMLNHVVSEGRERSDRTGTGTIGVFGYHFTHNMADGFPLITTKRLHWKSIVAELLWFLSGDTNIKVLRDQGVSIWDEWADANGDLGKIYGHQWRRFGAIYHTREGTDQIANLVLGLQSDPFGRRHIVTAWNPAELDKHSVGLPPCHVLFQCYVEPLKFSERYRILRPDWVPGNFVSPDDVLEIVKEMDITGIPKLGLSLQMYQRSADLFLGVPFNIASYALLLKMLAHVTNYHAHKLHITFGDLHIYKNHLDQVYEQQQRQPKKLPTVMLSPGIDDIFAFQFGDIILHGYDPHPTITGEVSV